MSWALGISKHMSFGWHLTRNSDSGSRLPYSTRTAPAVGTSIIPHNNAGYYILGISKQLHGWFRDGGRTSPQPLQNLLPVGFRKRLESEEAFQSQLSVLRVIHPGFSAHSYSVAHQDLSLSSGISITHDGITQFHGDWDKIEGGASAGH